MSNHTEESISPNSRPEQFIGARVQRTEDQLLLKGHGQYVDDLKLKGVLYSAFLRSPHAHAKILSINIERALEIPGVHKIYLHKDLPDSAKKRLPILVPNPAIKNLMMQEVLVSEEVCCVGDSIAFVVADNRYIAEDACALIEVEYEILPVVADCKKALQDGAPSFYSGIPHNLAAEVKVSFGSVEEAFQSAHHVTREVFWNNRGSAHPMETRAYAAEYHSVSGQLTVWASGQTPHLEKKNLIDLLEWNPEKIRIIHNDVGGGFGPKAIFYPEEAMVAIAACDMQCPIKWIEDRREHFYTATQERDQWWDISLAMNADAKILAMKIHMTHDNGAYLPWGIITPYIGVTTTPGPYIIPAIDVHLQVVYTNKNATSPVRGAGRPQAVFAMERILDKAARELGLDRAEIRRRNFIQPEQMPYNNGFIYRDGKPMVYDSGDYPKCQAVALEKIAYDQFPQRQSLAREQGRFIGIGIANFVEGTGLGPFEGATVRIQQNGRVTILTSASSQGQGHKTTFMQICADQLNIPLNLIDVVASDTNAISMGIGTFASRVTVNAGSSVFIAAKAVAQKILGLAAFLMKVAVDDVALIDGYVIYKKDQTIRKSFAELARVSQGMPGFSFPEGITNGLEATEYFSPEQSTYCNGTAAVELELDRDTCQIKILQYVMAHDSGNLINPLIVDGQVQGSIAHGIGNAILEDMQYDDQGQPITTNFGEYLLPTASDIPKVQMEHLCSPSPLNPLGVKGAGEGGTIPAAAAIVAAIENAIGDSRIFLTQAPMTPPRLFEILNKAGLYQ